MVVKVAGTITEAVTLTLEHVLRDLIDGQGNILVAVELPESAIYDTRVLAVLSAVAVAGGAYNPARQLVVTPVLGGRGSVG